MYKIWCTDKQMDLLTNVNIFKPTENECIEEFEKYYSKKYEFQKIVPYDKHSKSN